jgi:predicted lipoprotein with Yx(FWY)xxD motif
MHRIALAIMAAAALAAPAFAQSQKPLTDWRGMTLYTYERDTSSTSNCNGLCAATWTPMYAAADAIGTGDWSVIARGDGKKQWAYKGKPLYTYKNDAQPGDTSGNGRDNNAWRMAMP